MKDTSRLDKLSGLPEIKFPTPPNLPSLRKPNTPPSEILDTLDSHRKPKRMSMSQRKERYQGGPHGRIQMHGAHVRQEGKTVKLTNCRHTKIYKDSTEQEDNASFTFTFDNEDEAYSWLVSMAYGGATRD
eukprot:m.259928 g.259928  ORF g.259928 m.259928 type:complete len:130 (+) comp15981_c0_seq1:560-949(+)